MAVAFLIAQIITYPEAPPSDPAEKAPAPRPVTMP